MAAPVKPIKPSGLPRWPWQTLPLLPLPCSFSLLCCEEAPSAHYPVRPTFPGPHSCRFGHYNPDPESFSHAKKPQMCDFTQPAFPCLPHIFIQLLRILRSVFLNLRKLPGVGWRPLWISPYLILLCSLLAIAIPALIPPWNSSCESQLPSGIPSFLPDCVFLMHAGPFRRSCSALPYPHSSWPQSLCY